MEKEIYLIRGSKKETYDIFTNRILEAANSIAQKFKPAALKLTISEKPPPRLSVIPFKRNKIAAISIYKEDRSPVGSLLKMKGFSGAYRVQEELPVKYIKDWEDNEETPGVCLLTLFKQKVNIDYETFIDRWHNSHTPLSLKIHPLWNYSRNVVKNKLTPDSGDYDGIVEEHFKTSSDLLNPFKMFGNPFIILFRFIRIYRDINSFLDYKSIETYLSAEYHIVSE